MPDPTASSSRIWWMLAIGFACFWMICLFFFVGRPGGWLDHTEMSERADYDWAPLDLKDHPVPFERFKGKTLLLNFWATWCGPCVQEMPSIARLASDRRWRGKNIAFVCVSTDDSTEKVRHFLDGVTWDMTFLRADKIPAVYVTDGIPATFLIAPDGRIAATAVGGADWSETYVADFLEKLVSPGPPSK
jgi:thiol-disulfide isomerase/thioredoxin